MCCAVQAVVFGVSCAYDVQDSMEKRVRSRFSNRKIFLPGLGSAKVRAGPAPVLWLACWLLARAACRRQHCYWCTGLFYYSRSAVALPSKRRSAHAVSFSSDTGIHAQSSRRIWPCTACFLGLVPVLSLAT